MAKFFYLKLYNCLVAGRPIVKGGGMPNQFSSNAIEFQQVQRKLSQQNLPPPPNHQQMKPQNSSGGQPFNSNMEFQQVKIYRTKLIDIDATTSSFV